jgi:hypothetical protein
MVLFYAFVVDHDAYLSSVMYVPVTFLIWAAVRLRRFGTANLIALVAIISILSEVRGTGVFAGDMARHAVLTLLVPRSAKASAERQPLAPIAVFETVSHDPAMSKRKGRRGRRAFASSNALIQPR